MLPAEDSLFFIASSALWEDGGLRLKIAQPPAPNLHGNCDAMLILGYT